MGRRGVWCGLAFALLAWLSCPPPAAAVGVQQVAVGLNGPVAITHAGDGSGRLFITEQQGRILIYDGTQVLPTPFLDITSLVLVSGEYGLLSVVFHPGYTTNGFFYVDYSRVPDGATVIARYQVSAADPNVADPGSAFILMTIPQPNVNHHGGQLQFGPDGYLYISAGNGGGVPDPAQDLMSLLGKLLRIDVDGGSPYAIPPDNPFVGDPLAREEIWAYGLRNPWRFSFDRQDGDLFIGDVGQDDWEEIDFQPAPSPGGENYGWPVMEGNACYEPPTGCNMTGLTLPILVYDHSLGCSVIGGYRYRGAAVPSISGNYVYSDVCSGRVWGAVPDGGGGWTTAQLLQIPVGVSSFGEDETGELYLTDVNEGGVYQLVESSADLFLTKTASADPVAAGEPLSYVISVYNLGPTAALGVTVTDALPAGLRFLGTPSTACTAAGGTVTCNLGLMAAGDGVDLTLTVAVDPGAPGTLTNTATVSAADPDPNPVNNTASESITVIAGDSGLVELSHGSDQVHDLAALSPTTADRDYYRVGQNALSSYEVVVDATSGDIGTPVQVERIGDDTATVLQTGEAVSFNLDMAQSLRWMNSTSGEIDKEFVRVRAAPGGCSTDCGPDDVYRIRAWETTYSVPRFNNAGTQVTVLIVQNPGTYAIAGEVYFWSTGGALLETHDFALPARSTLVLNTATLPGASGQSGTITVANDARYGDLSGKTVALEPSTGFSFGSPMLPRPR